MIAWLGLLLLATPDARAQDALRWSAVRTVEHGEAVPELRFQPGVGGHLSVRVSCGTRDFAHSGAIRPGVEVVLPLKGLGEGRHRCEGAVVLHAADGSEGELSLDVEVASLPGLTLDASLDDLDRDAHTLRLRANRPLVEGSFEVIGPRGVQLAGGDLDLSDPAAPLVAWPKGTEAVRIVARGKDADGFFADREATPWFLSVPHEDVVFASGSASIPAEQEPKLADAMAALARALDTYGAVVQVQLYVAGYTDTVGTAEANLALSERRAKAIAAWFRANGYRGEVFYMGLGESALAVSTPDETAEAANRRALYVLSAGPPPVSADLPVSRWRKL